MALSMSERRRLAEIENGLILSDPLLARMMSDMSVGRSPRRRLIGIAAGAVTFAATVLAGAMLGGNGIAALIVVIGIFGLLAVLAVGAVMLDSARPSQSRTSGKEPAILRPWPGADQGLLWWGLWHGPV